MRTALLMLASVCLVAATATTVGAHPPSEPEHGLNETAYWMLWSGDADDANDSVVTGTSGHGTLARGTDLPLDVSRQVPERWNRRDIATMPETGLDESAHPTNVTREDGYFIKDAYVEIGAVQPSTIAHLAPGTQPHYVGRSGSVLSAIDYRVELPDDASEDPTAPSNEVEAHSVSNVTLFVDGTPQDRTTDTRTPSLAFRDLDGRSGTNVTLTVEATITAQIDQDLSGPRNPCRDSGPNQSCRNRWDDPDLGVEEQVTVRDSTTVTLYDLGVAGYWARYPNGDGGVVVYKNTPWLGYEAGEHSVSGIFRFYAARDTQWEQLTHRSETGTTERHSPFHPVQVHAYPIETGPSPGNRATTTILDVYGTRQPAPDLPADVTLESVEEPYTASYGIASRLEDEDDFEEVAASGLVRGEDVTDPRSEFVHVHINESRLTLTVQNTTANEVTVQAALRDADTGAPIETAARGGYLVVEGRRVNTTANGTVNATVPRSPGGVSARYEPGHWWRESPGYVGDTTAVQLGPPVLEYLRFIFEAGVPIGLLLLAAALVDRITGWRIWPPWRGYK